jgi:hypothetical protein
VRFGLGYGLVSYLVIDDKQPEGEQRGLGFNSGFNRVHALFTELRASLLTVASPAVAWVAVWREWMA